MKKLKDNEVYNVNIPTYYVESESEMQSIPASAPAGTIVEVNATSGFKVFMKNSTGTFNEL